MSNFRFANELQFTLLPIPSSPGSTNAPSSAPPGSPINYGISTPFADVCRPTTHKHSKRSHPTSPLANSSTSLPLPGLGGRSRANSNATASSSRSRSSSPDTGGGKPRIDSMSPLVADVQLVRTRLLIAKRYTVYNNPIVPWRSVIIGYAVTFHTPPSSSARVKDAELVLNFQEAEKNGPAPVIKAISPGGSTFLGVRTDVEKQKSTTVGLTLGYDPHGALNVSRVGTEVLTFESAAQLQVSGVESSRALITVQEDPATHHGVPITFNFAVLLFLPSLTSNEFEVELSVAASVGSGLGEQWNKLFGSPRAWVMAYDGVTEMGVLDVGRLDEMDGKVVQDEEGVVVTK